MKRRNFVKYAAMIPAAVVGTVVTGKVVATPVDDFPKHDLQAHPLVTRSQAIDRLRRINETQPNRQTYSDLRQTECIARLSNWFDKYPFAVMSRYVHRSGVSETIGGGRMVMPIEGSSFIRHHGFYRKQMYFVPSRCDVVVQHDPPYLEVWNPSITEEFPEQTWFFRPESKGETVERCLKCYAGGCLFSTRAKIRAKCFDSGIAQENVESFIDTECFEVFKSILAFDQTYKQPAFIKPPKLPTEKLSEMGRPYSHKEYPHFNLVQDTIQLSHRIRMQQQYGLTEQDIARSPFNIKGTETARFSGKEPN